MRYLLRQKLFSLGQKFYVQNDSGDDMFIVEGGLLPVLGDKLSFKDLAGNELASIRQVFASSINQDMRDGVLRPSTTVADIYHLDKLWASLKRERFTYTHCTFFIDVPGPDDLVATGDLFRHSYSFTRSGLVMARVSKEWFKLSSSYGVETFGENDDILILASTVAIDLMAFSR